MRALISAGDHDPKGHHHMVVDGHGLLLDLSGVQTPFPLHDPTIVQTEWTLVQDGTRSRPGGIITRQDGSKQVFYDEALLAPYLAAYRARRAQLEDQPDALAKP